MTAQRPPHPHLQLLRELGELRHGIQRAVTSIRTPVPFRASEPPLDGEAVILDCLSHIATQLELIETRVRALELQETPPSDGPVSE
jgi:hypothetical protein